MSQPVKEIKIILSWNELSRASFGINAPGRFQVGPESRQKTPENLTILRLLTEYGLDMSLLNKVVWVTDQGSDIISALRPYHRLDCKDQLHNTVMRHALNLKELAKEAPT